MDSESGSVPLAFYFVLKYLPSYELLVMSRVSRSLRDVVINDTLLWVDLIIDKPLNRRISNNTLMHMAEKAQGRLRRLALMNCHKVTDEGLLRFVENNPLLEKLYLPGCTGLTPEGIIKSVRRLTERNSRLKSLKISGIYHTNKEHISILQSCLQVTTTIDQLKLQNQAAHYYHISRNPSLCSSLDDTHQLIDVEICPKCNEVKMVFDCPRETCREQGGRTVFRCRGCYHCFPRCEECGVCIAKEEEEQGGILCAESLCSACWLQQPKCSFCNRPYCRRHADEYLQQSPSKTTGFVCDICTESYLKAETM